MSLSQAKGVAEAAQVDNNIKQVAETLVEMIKNPRSTYSQEYATFMLKKIEDTEKSTSLTNFVNHIREKAQSSKGLFIDIKLLEKIESLPLDSGLKSTVNQTKNECEQELKKREEVMKAKELAAQKAKEEQKVKEAKKLTEKAKEEKQSTPTTTAVKEETSTPSTTPTPHP